MNAMNEFQGAGFVALLIALRFMLPFLGIYSIFRVNSWIQRGWRTPDPDDYRAITS